MKNFEKKYGIAYYLKWDMYFFKEGMETKFSCLWRNIKNRISREYTPRIYLGGKRCLYTFVVKREAHIHKTFCGRKVVRLVTFEKRHREVLS